MGKKHSIILIVAIIVLLGIVAYVLSVLNSTTSTTTNIPGEIEGFGEINPIIGNTVEPTGETESRTVRIGGMVNLNTGELNLDPLMFFENTELDQEREDSDYYFLFLTSDRKELGRFYFSLAPPPDDAEFGDIDLFSAIFEVPAGTSIIRAVFDDRVWGELRKSINVPSIEILYPNGGEKLEGETTISWSGSDLDNDKLFYTPRILCGENEGYWNPITIDSEYENITINLNNFPGGDSCSIKVEVSDGWNTAEAISEPFSIDTKPPTVTILDPDDGRTFNECSSILGRASATDPETGNIEEDESFEWKSNIDGMLGNGDSLDIELNPGTHLISVIVTDPEGKTSSDSVSIIVQADSDCDQMVDDYEIKYGLDPYKDDRLGDLDGDGLPNYKESELGTNPSSLDTDGDGVGDDREVYNSTDPLDPEDN